MAVSVNFAGNTYQIPEDEETGWESLTNFLVALAKSSATTLGMSFSSRIVTTSPATFQPTDTALWCNFSGPGAKVVNLPAGTTKQFAIIGDISNGADLLPITINPASGQTINGASSYEIADKRNVVTLQFNGIEWVVVNFLKTVFAEPLKVENTPTNKSFVQTISTNKLAPETVQTGKSCSANFDGMTGISGIVSLDSGESFEFATSFKSGRVTVISDISNIFRESDSGVGLVVTKASDSSLVSFKSRFGVDKVIQIRSNYNTINNASVWAL
jgi:hypothetical protein